MKLSEIVAGQARAATINEAGCVGRLGRPYLKSEQHSQARRGFAPLLACGRGKRRRGSHGGVILEVTLAPIPAFPRKRRKEKNRAARF